MNNQNDFNAVLTWLGVALGVVTLGAAVFAVFRLTSDQPGTKPVAVATVPSYTCNAVRPDPDGKFNLSFQEGTKPDVALTFTIPAGYILCDVDTNSDSLMKSWKLVAADKYDPNAKTTDFSVAILKQNTSVPLETQIKNYRAQVEARKQKSPSTVINDLTFQSYKGIQTDYNDGTNLRHHRQIFVNPNYAVMIWSIDGDTATEDLFRSLQIKETN